MPIDPAALGPYHASILNARLVALRIAEAQQQQIILLLEQYSSELFAAMGTGTPSNAARLRAQAQAIISNLIDDLEDYTASGVKLTARAMEDIHARATVQLLQAVGAETGLAVGMGGINLTAAQGLLARPELSAAFKNIRAQAVKAADGIIVKGVLRGSTSTNIARQLRTAIVGAESLPADLVVDNRKISYKTLEAMNLEPTKANLDALRKQARSVSGRAQLIARTEITTAEHEASVMLAEESPVVASIQWYLSNRHPKKDVCDVFAKSDMYGLGPGRYDPRKVPARPHPRCLCGRRHVLREPEEFGQARGKPPKLSIEPKKALEAFDITQPSQLAAITRALGVAEGRNAMLAKKQAATRARAQQVELQKKQKAELQQIQATEQAASDVLAKAASAKSIKEMKAVAAEAQQAKAKAKAVGASAATDIAQKAEDLVAAKLAQKQAANKAASLKHAAKKKAEKLALQHEAVLNEAVQTWTDPKKAGIPISNLDKDYIRQYLKAVQQQAINEGKNLAQMKAALSKGASDAIDILTAEKKAGLLIDSYDANASVPILKLKKAELEDAIANAKKVGAGEAAAQAQYVLDDLVQNLAAKEAAEQAAKATAALAQDAAVKYVAGKTKEALELAAKNKTLVGKLKEAVATAEEALDAALKLKDSKLIMDAQIALSKTQAALQKRLEQNAKAAATAKAKAKAAKAPKSASAMKGTLDAGDELQKIQAADATAAKTAAKAEMQPAAPKDALTADVVLGQQIGQQAGSNPGGLFRGTDGVKRYVKYYADPAQAASEALSNDIYRRLGLYAPKSQVVKGGPTGYMHVADILDNRGTIGNLGLTEKHANEILDGFAADVLTGNWDAVGLSLDNVVVLANGKIARIDQGGSLLFRAKAGRKPTTLLGQISEWDVFSSTKNPAYSSVFQKAGITSANALGDRVIAQIDEILALRTSVGGWARYIDDTVPPGALSAVDKKAIVDMLENRTKLLEAKKAAVKKAMADAKAAAAAAAKAQKEFEKRLKSGQLGARKALRDVDKAQIAEAAADLKKRLTPEQVNAVADQIKRNTSSGGIAWNAGLTAVRSARLAHLKRVARKNGIDPAAVTFLDKLYAGWQRTASGERAAAIKWYATKEHGIGTQHHWGYYIDKDAAEQARVLAEGKRMVTDNGRFREEEMLELFRAERNFNEALGATIGMPKIKLWRAIGGETFQKNGLPTPRTGETVIFDTGSVQGWAWVKNSFGGTLEIEGEIEWHEILGNWITRKPSGYSNEHEVWVIGGPRQYRVSRGGGH